MSQIALANVDKKDRANWRGHFALLFNQAIGGANSQGILAVWYAWITHESGKTIYGNNPLNLTCSKGDGCYAGQNGYYHFAGNTRNFASFATPQDGAKAVAGLLTISAYRYPAITKAAKADNYYAMITAIITSCWVSCNRPGYGGLDGSFFSTWNSMRTLVAKDVKSGDIGNIPGGNTSNTNVIQTLLTRWLSSQNLSANDVITSTQVDTFLAYVKRDTGIDISGEFPKASIVGKTWATAFNMLGGMSGPPDDPLAGITSSIDALVKLLDPENLFRLTAFLIGLAMLGIGSKMVFDASARAL